MNKKISDLIENLKSLTLLEASELVREIETTFNVDASSTQSSPLIVDSLSPADNKLDTKEEKTEFAVSLEVVPPQKKIAILKVVRSLTGFGLKDAKSLVESAPKLLKESISKEDAEDMKKKLEDAGASVILK